MSSIVLDAFVIYGIFVCINWFMINLIYSNYKTWIGLIYYIVLENIIYTVFNLRDLLNYTCVKNWKTWTQNLKKM